MQPNSFEVVYLLASLNDPLKHRHPEKYKNRLRNSNFLLVYTTREIDVLI